MPFVGWQRSQILPSLRCYPARADHCWLSPQDRPASVQGQIPGLLLFTFA